MLKNNKKYSSQGFTLFEMLLTLAIVAIVAAMGGPSFYDYIKNKQLTSAADDSYNTFLYARAEALREGKNVYIKPLTGSDWSTGHAALLDGGDGICNTCPSGSGVDDDVVIQLSSINANLQVSASGTHVIFNGGGEIDSGFTLDYCDNRRDEVGKQLHVLASGFMAVIKKEDCS